MSIGHIFQVFAVEHGLVESSVAEEEVAVAGVTQTASDQRQRHGLDVVTVDSIGGVALLVTHAYRSQVTGHRSHTANEGTILLYIVELFFKLDDGYIFTCTSHM